MEDTECSILTEASHHGLVSQQYARVKATATASFLSRLYRF